MKLPESLKTEKLELSDEEWTSVAGKIADSLICLTFTGWKKENQSRRT